MMDPIQNLTSVVDILRRQLQARRTEKNIPATPTTQGAQTTRTPVKVGTVQRRTRDRIAALDPLDPNYYRKARRAFLQVVLGDEFGDAAASDPGFFQLLEDVEKLIDGDETLNHAFEELFKRLGTGA